MVQAEMKIKSKRRLSEVINAVPSDHRGPEHKEEITRGKLVPGKNHFNKHASNSVRVELASFGKDLRTGNWLKHPASSFKIILTVLLSWIGWSLIYPERENPFSSLIFISYKLPATDMNLMTGNHYDKGIKDLLFVGFYIVVYSFVRQILTEYILRALALRLGIKKEGKIMRFVEQGYAIIYYGTASVFGTCVMYRQRTWWYQTIWFWLDVPVVSMSAQLKYYYLLEMANWLQQSAIMILGLEKPRKDYVELVSHHIVTVWLIGWSYFFGMTSIGVAIFVSMNIPDTLLALSKCINYVDEGSTGSAISMSIFTISWIYFRHYLNLWILWSVYSEYHTIPKWALHKSLNILKLEMLVWWVQPLMFLSLMGLQGLNIMWLIAIFKVLYRAVTSSSLSDVRSEDEDDDGPEGIEKKKQ